MFRYLFVLSILVAATHGQDINRIVGGFVTTINRYPFQVSLRDRRNQHFCGGSIISRRTIVTAAHCVRRLQTRDLTVVAGSTYLNQRGVRRNVIRIRLHPQYSVSTYNWDGAVLILNSGLPLSSTIAIIPMRANEANTGTSSTTSGWGSTYQGGPLSSQLRAVSVPIVSRATCIRNYAPRVITPIMICAGLSGGGRDSCQGDSGGPITNYVGNSRQLAGIVSWGEGCARPNKPGVYTNIPRLRTWIRSVTV